MINALGTTPVRYVECSERTVGFLPYTHVVTLIAISAFLAGFLRHVTGHVVWGAVYILCGLLAGALLLSRVRVPVLSWLIISGVFLGLSVMTLTSINDQGLRPFFFLLVMLSAALLARLMIDFKSMLTVSAFAMAIVSAVIFYQFIRHGLDPAAYNEVFVHASRNRLGAFLLITAVATTVAYYQERGGIIILPGLIALLFSLPLYGRSTIAGALMLLGVVFLARFQNKRIALVVFLIIGMLLGGMLVPKIWDWVVASTNFGRSLESPRWAMLYEYVTAMDSVHVIFGMPLDQVALIRSYSGNPHNSFIRLHSMYGAVGILLVLLTLVLFWLRSRLFILAMMSILVFRIAMDTVALGDYLDHFIFAVLIVGLREKKGIATKC